MIGIVFMTMGLGKKQGEKSTRGNTCENNDPPWLYPVRLLTDVNLTLPPLTLMYKATLWEGMVNPLYVFTIESETWNLF